MVGHIVENRGRMFSGSGSKSGAVWYRVFPPVVRRGGGDARGHIGDAGWEGGTFSLIHPVAHHRKH